MSVIQAKTRLARHNWLVTNLNIGVVVMCETGTVMQERDESFRAKLVDLYSELGTLKQVSKALKITRQTLNRRMLIHGVTLEDVKEGLMNKKAAEVQTHE